MMHGSYLISNLKNMLGKEQRVMNKYIQNKTKKWFTDQILFFKILVDYDFKDFSVSDTISLSKYNSVLWIKYVFLYIN